MELGKQRGKDGKTRSDTKHYFSIGTGKNRKHFQSNFYIYLPSENVTVVLHFDSIIFFLSEKIYQPVSCTIYKISKQHNIIFIFYYNTSLCNYNWTFGFLSPFTLMRNFSLRRHFVSYRFWLPRRHAYTVSAAKREPSSKSNISVTGWPNGFIFSPSTDTLELHHSSKNQRDRTKTFCLGRV